MLKTVSQAADISQPISLPNNFPHNTRPPHFLCDDKVRWIPLSGQPDWGIILGCFYAYAQHQHQWNWKYVVLLDQGSSSSRWAVTDTAWQEDLEPLMSEET